MESAINASEAAQLPSQFAEWLALHMADLLEFSRDGEFEVHEAANWFLDRGDAEELFARYRTEAEASMISCHASLANLLDAYGFDVFDIEDAMTYILAAHAEQLIEHGAVDAFQERAELCAAGRVPVAIAAANSPRL